jgi:hypothetical protein
MVRESCLIKLVEVFQGRPKTRVGAYHLGGMTVPICLLSPPEAPLRFGVSAYRSVGSGRLPELRRERPRVGSACPDMIDASKSCRALLAAVTMGWRGALETPCSETCESHRHHLSRLTLPLPIHVDWQMRCIKTTIPIVGDHVALLGASHKTSSKTKPALDDPRISCTARLEEHASPSHHDERAHLPDHCRH